MNKLVRIGGAIVLAMIGVWLLTLHSDREFIALPPTTGQAYVVPATFDRIYSQSFTATASSISRVAVYIHPLEGVPATSTVSLIVTAGEERVENKLPIVLADGDTSLAADIRPVITTAPGERITLTITVPAELSGKVGIATRQQDDTFNRDAVFTIDDEAQPNPMAYHIHTRERTLVATYVGGLALLAAAVLLASIVGISWQHMPMQMFYSIAVTCIANAPFLSERGVLMLIPIQTVLMFGSLRLLGRLGLPLYAQLLGAHTIAFTTWWPLVFIGGHDIISMSFTSFKDVFLNPRQSGIATTGSYIGMPALVLALVGILRWRQWGLLALVVGLFISPIIAAITLAAHAAAGLKSIMVFIQKEQSLVTLLAYGITYLMLLELWSVYGRLLQVL